MTSRIHYRLVVLAMALAVALPIAPRELVVLCFGADGHVALEAVSKGCSDASIVCDAEDGASCTDGCGSCRDVQLIAGTHAVNRSNDSSLLIPVSLVTAPAWSMDLARDDSGRRHALAPAPPRSTGGISSRDLVALLI